MSGKRFLVVYKNEDGNMIMDNSQYYETEEDFENSEGFPTFTDPVLGDPIIMEVTSDVVLLIEDENENASIFEFDSIKEAVENLDTKPDLIEVEENGNNIWGKGFNIFSSPELIEKYIDYLENLDDDDENYIENCHHKKESE